VATPVRVLIVEDRPEDAELALHELRRAGFDPAWHRVEDETEFLAQLDPPPDVILADYHLPDFGASRALGLLAARGLDLPVIVVSGMASEEVVAECMKHGASDYLLKDRLARLGPAIEQALQAKRLRDERRRLGAVAFGFAEVAHELAATLDPAQVADRVVATVARLFSVRRAAVYRVEPASRTLVCVAAAGGDSGDWIGRALPLDTGIAGRAVSEGRPVWSADVLTDPQLPLSEWAIGRLREDGFRSVAGVPLVAGQEVLGVLMVRDVAGRAFSPEELRLLTGFAAQAAATTANARLFELSETRRRAAESLAAVARLVTESLDPEEVARRVADSACTLLKAQHAALYRIEPATGDLVLLALAGDVGPGIAPGLVLPAGAGVVGLAVKERRPVTTANVLATPRVSLPPGPRALFEHAPYRAVLAAPLVARDAVVGVFSVGDALGRVFSDREVELLQAFADQAALALENARLYEETARQRREAEAAVGALRESEERFRSAFEHSPTGIALQGPDGRYVRVNHALCEMVGYSESELLATRWDAITHPDDREIDLDHSRRMRAGEIRGYQVEKRYLHRDGRAVWALVAVSLVRTPDGQPLHYIVQTQDTTARRQAEHERGELEAQLLQAQKLEAIGRLAGGIAHDFNNLLTVIQGRAQLLLRRLPSEVPERRYVGLIQSTADRAGALTHQLLAFSRKQILQPVVLDLNALVGDMKPLLRRLIREDVELAGDLEPSLGRIKADPAQLQQVLMNLVVNARDAMPAGGRLQIATANVELDDLFVRANPGARPGPHVRLAVRDTGTGMDAATRARIFEPFFTTKEAGHGTGLGLATVYGIVKQSEGYIEVESEPGRGTTFSLYFARVDEAPAPPVPPDAGPDQVARGRETILLVEDDEPLRELTQEVLEAQGYRVLVAPHGADALDVAERHPEPVDLLLTDVIMPRMSGRALAERLGQTRPGLRVLYMSGYTDDALGSHGVLDPDLALLHKPFTPDALARAVREALDRATP
jgi:PAS domain S-box-containing protein